MMKQHLIAAGEDNFWQVCADQLHQLLADDSGE